MRPILLYTSDAASKAREQARHVVWHEGRRAALSLRYAAGKVTVPLKVALELVLARLGDGDLDASKNPQVRLVTGAVGNPF